VSVINEDRNVMSWIEFGDTATFHSANTMKSWRAVYSPGFQLAKLESIEHLKQLGNPCNQRISLIMIFCN